MADEDVTIRLSLRDEASQPLRAVAEEVLRVSRELQRADRQATAAARAQAAAVQDARNRIAGLHASVTSLGATIGSRLFGATRIGAIGLAGMGAAAVGFGVQALSSFQQSQTALDTLTGSVSAGHRLFAQLQAYDLSTAFDFRQITQAAQTLEQFGITGRNTLPTLRALGDVAALTSNPSENLARMATALGQINTKGAVRAEELQQLSEAGLPAYAVAAQAAGIPVAQLQDQMARGTLALTPAQLNAAITNYQGPLARYRGAAQGQGNTLAGALSNAPGQVRRALAEVAQPYTAEITQIIQAGTAGAVQVVRQVGPGLFRLVTQLGTFLVREIPRAAPLLNTLIGGLSQLVTAAGPVMDQMLGPLSGEVGDSLTGMFTELAPLMPGIATATVEFVRVLPAMVTLLGDMVSIAGPVVGFVNDMLAIDEVRQGAAGLLIALMGYSALTRIVGPILEVAGAIRALRVAQAGEAVGGVGGAGGAARGMSRGARIAAGVGGGLAGGGLMAGGLMEDPNALGGTLSTIGGAALTGAAIGSIFPGFGTAIGGAAGALGGALIVGGRRYLNHDNAVAAGATSNTNLNVSEGAIVVQPQYLDPSNAAAVGQGLGAGLYDYVDERAARR